MPTTPAPSDREVFFPDNEIIVSKTDLKGRITYANRTFCRVAGYTEAELLGQPHSIIRHPDMPRAVFKLLWDTINSRKEIFAYVKNLAKSGDFDWVSPSVTPSYDKNNNIVGFHSSRRVPYPKVVANTIVPLYAAVLNEERQHRNGQQSLAAGFDFLMNFLQSRNTTYDVLIFSL